MRLKNHNVIAVISQSRKVVKTIAFPSSILMLEAFSLKMENRILSYQDEQTSFIL